MKPIHEEHLENIQQTQGEDTKATEKRHSWQEHRTQNVIGTTVR